MLDHLVLFRHLTWIVFLWMALSLLAKKTNAGFRILSILYLLFALTSLVVPSFSILLFPVSIILAMMNRGLRATVPLPFFFIIVTMILFTLVTVGVPRYGTYYYFPAVMGFFLLLFDIPSVWIGRFRSAGGKPLLS